MQHDQLVHDLRNAVSIRLLTNPLAPLILGFLNHAFKQPGRVTVPHSELLDQLEHYLEAARELEPARYPGEPAAYLRQWCDEEHRFLRRYHEPGRDDPVYELNADSERALGWVQELRKREFVGTESRFLRIFTLLHEMVEMSTTDPETRLRQLEARQAELQAQIDAIRASGQVEAFTVTQIKERFADANATARRLVADFREVEENFRTLARDVQKQQAQPGLSKGQIVGYVLDADAALKESDQGRSFYSFWQFLVSPTKQEELQELLERVYALPGLPVDGDEAAALAQLKRRLLDAGARIVESNRQLAERVRKVLDEQRTGEARRVQELLLAIMQAAHQIDPLAVDAALAGSPFLSVTGAPGVTMPMERQLWRPAARTEFAGLDLNGEDSEEEVLDWSKLFAYPFVDEARLGRNLEIVLQDSSAVTLPEVLARFPIQHGLAELVTYLSIAAKHKQHRIQPELRDAVTLTLGDRQRIVRIPRIVFSSI